MESGKYAYLLTLISEGDREAFKMLFEEFYPKTKVFLENLIKDEMASEDIAQDIFMKLWTLRGGLPEIKSFNLYIYRVVRNAALNWLRSRYPSVSLSSVTLSDGHDTEEEYYKKEKELLVRIAVAQMPFQRQRIFKMSRYQGFTNDEIAVKLNIARKTVENHLTQALRDIRAVLSVLTFFL